MSVSKSQAELSKSAKSAQGRRKGSGRKGPCPDTRTVIFSGTASKATSDRVGVPPDSLMQGWVGPDGSPLPPKVARALARVREALSKDPRSGGLWPMQV